MSAINSVNLPSCVPGHRHQPVRNEHVSLHPQISPTARTGAFARFCILHTPLVPLHPIRTDPGSTAVDSSLMLSMKYCKTYPGSSSSPLRTSQYMYVEAPALAFRSHRSILPSDPQGVQKRRQHWGGRVQQALRTFCAMFKKHAPTTQNARLILHATIQSVKQQSFPRDPPALQIVIGIFFDKFLTHTAQEAKSGRRSTATISQQCTSAQPHVKHCDEKQSAQSDTKEPVPSNKSQLLESPDHTGGRRTFSCSNLRTTWARANNPSFQFVHLSKCPKDPYVATLLPPGCIKSSMSLKIPHPNSCVRLLPSPEAVIL